MNTLKVAMIQMNIDKYISKNIDTTNNFIKKVAKENVDIAILPEMFCCPYETSNFPLYSQQENSPCYISISNMAKKNKIYIVAGSMPERDENGNIFNTSYVFDRNGNQIAKHRKMHLFDIQIEGGQHFKESDKLSAGNNVTVFNTEFCKIGLAICYDIRFPELSRLMVDNGAKIIIIPAAFNMSTGPSHWEILFKSRALDNQVYTIGVSSARNYDAPYISYGNSIIVSPWGEIIERMDENEGYRICTLDLDYVDKIRKELPLLEHRRKDIYKLI